MALSDAELAKVKQDLLEAGGIFSSPIPATAEDMKNFVDTEKGKTEIVALTDALAMGEKEITSIDNVFEFVTELVHPALVARDLEITERAAEVRAKFKKAILASANEARAQGTDQSKTFKNKNADQKLAGIVQKSTVKRHLETTKSEKEILTAELKKVSQQEWNEKLKIMSANLNIASASFKEMSRQAAIGGAKALSHIPAAADQFAKNFQALALNAKKMAERKYEDAPKAFDDFKKSFFKVVKDTFDMAAKFLHKVKKTLDPLRSLHHERKENAAFRANFLTYVEGQAKSTASMEERLVRSDAVAASSLAGDNEKALELQKTQTPSEIAAIQKKEAEIAAELAKQKAEFEALTERNQGLYEKFMAEDALVAKRLAEDKAIADIPKGVYEKTKKSAEDLLRGKKDVVAGLRGRASTASDIDSTKGPDAGGRDRSDSVKSI